MRNFSIDTGAGTPYLETHSRGLHLGHYRIRDNSQNLFTERGPVMKTTIVATLVFGLVILMGCDNRTAELEKEIVKIQTQSSTLQQDLAARDKYIDEVMQAVNQVYKDLEQAKSKEAKLVEKTQGAEGQASFTSAQMRQSVLDQITAIDSNLKENRKKLSSLQKKLRASEVKYASLDEMVQNLKSTLEQREQSIAVLEAKVQGLETSVAEKARLVMEKETIIEEQKNRMNTVYYVVGTRNELKEKGIITDEGGFLWGLLGSTTVLSSGIDRSQFTPFDWTRDHTIHVNGSIDEMVPKRNEEFFALAETEESKADLTIKEPTKFWQDRYLVIVVD